MPKPRASLTPPRIPAWRLVDGTQPEDWSPGPGDAPCHTPDHRDHSRNGCPSLHDDPEETP